MEEGASEFRVFNPDKNISIELTLNALIKHRDAASQAREGIISGEVGEVHENQRVINKVKGLFKMISAQKSMILIARPIINFPCHSKWKSKYSEQEQVEHPFEKEDNDYNNLILYQNILSEAEKDIVKAEQTPSKEDDYILEKSNHEGQKVYYLTTKYYEMLEGLEETYEKIYGLMLKYKIVSAGIEEDEVQTYSDQEKEAIRRIVEA